FILQHSEKSRDTPDLSARIHQAGFRQPGFFDFFTSPFSPPLPFLYSFVGERLTLLIKKEAGYAVSPYPTQFS
ncbi:hypothetical protein, partial [Klebsiella pneumoniae]|uniref:hypothetical protein n=1 Tax=Klebsiella pneumoniae TaxID=573 RepID=UPI001C6F982F